MRPFHLREAAADALFTIDGVMPQFAGQAADRTRMTFEFMAKKSCVCCLTFYVASTSTFFSISSISHLTNNQFGELR